MSKDISFRKGADINLKGKAKNFINDKITSQSYALQPDDFFSLTPKLEIRENDYVSQGSPIFHDKKNPEIKFVSPVSGIISNIVRGPKRKIETIEIELNGNKKIVHDIPSNPDKKSIIELLTLSGCWPFIRQRPYNVIANPGDIPRYILISCFTSAPLDVDFDFILKNNHEDFQRGVQILNKLTKKSTILTVNSKSKNLFNNINDVDVVGVSGPHPSSNESVQIQKISPINMGDKVWVIRPEDVVNIGLFFKTGTYTAQRTVAVAGSCIKNPQYFRTKIGVKIDDLIKIAKLNKKRDIRFINGDVLSGSLTSQDGYIGFYNNLLSVIPEGNKYRMFGWLPFVDNDIPSLSKTSFSWLFRNKTFDIDTNLNGEERALVVTGEMEKVFPMDIYPMQLLKVCMTGDIEKMEAYGIYEVVPEDFGLIDYSCTSKIEAQEIISDAIELMIKEVG
ncbi:MAG: NADH:ubiquinone reductase (Na(+)-transporting) subunit A [Flavobacteriaceae bacterium]|nr:NADH:ubiquinone reductase (Na(+)-transporting) subunit A [Flavobacteriaceae bacterium]|tara:strand:+ start:8491 stop:9837 length:1347 start_codon:yes stop_codon:yes gene_type:complete